MKNKRAYEIKNECQIGTHYLEVFEDSFFCDLNCDKMYINFTILTMVKGTVQGDLVYSLCDHHRHPPPELCSSCKTETLYHKQ